MPIVTNNEKIDLFISFDPRLPPITNSVLQLLFKPKYFSAFSKPSFLECILGRTGLPE